MAVMDKWRMNSDKRQKEKGNLQKAFDARLKGFGHYSRRHCEVLRRE